ncbi:MAG TPA: hypothetical protein VJC20_01305 [Candidatus Paceibacterota bacterium]
MIKSPNNTMHFAAWSLRLGFGIMYLYSGYDLIAHPTAWHWAVPLWLRTTIMYAVDLNTYLQFQGAIEIVFAVVLLAWFLKPIWVKWVAFLSVIEFGAILFLAFLPWSEANFLITFRDIGLLGGAIALVIISRTNYGSSAR